MHVAACLLHACAQVNEWQQTSISRNSWIVYDRLSQDKVHSQTQDVKNVHTCLFCGKNYSRRDSLTRHWKYECGKQPQFECPYCGKKTHQKSNLKIHIRKLHESFVNT